MGKHFGNLQRLSGVTYYRLSPQELQPFKGILFPGIPHAARRLLVQGSPLLIMFGVCYAVKSTVEEINETMFRKDPEMYKDDV